MFFRGIEKGVHELPSISKIERDDNVESNLRTLFYIQNNTKIMPEICEILLGDP